MADAPDFVIAGAMRAGTTALAAALGRHPDVLMSTPKEPNFFATRLGALEYCGPGDQWFARQNARTWAEYQSCFSGGCGRKTGEASAAYLALPGTATLIAEALPCSKVILVLRDPMVRAVSAHGYLRATGREPERDFTVALSLEAARRSEGYGPIWWYSSASDYRAGLDAYLEAFGRDRLLVVTTEHLNRDSASTVNGICEFLGLDTHQSVEAALAERVNESGAPRSRIVARVLYPPDPLRKALRGIAPPGAVERVRRVRRVRPARSDQSAVRPDLFPASTRKRFRAVAESVEQLVGVGLSGVWPSRNLE